MLLCLTPGHIVKGLCFAEEYAKAKFTGILSNVGACEVLRKDPERLKDLAEAIELLMDHLICTQPHRLHFFVTDVSIHSKMTQVTFNSDICLT